jgi:alpha-tubulin suppressor-like RCC1 family protein
VHFFNGNWPCSSTPVRAGAPPLVAIAAGDSFTCGVDRDGRAWCWGGNGDGQLGDGTTATRERPAPVSGTVRFVAVASGRLRQACGVAAGGHVWCWGSGVGFGPGTARPGLVPAPAAEGTAFTSVTAVWNHTCALDVSGAAWCWGNNAYGQLGIGP